MSQHQAERDHLRADGDDHSAGASHRGGGADDQEGGAFGERESARALEKLTSGLTLFSTRRPQNFVAGLSSGLKNVTRGVLAGTASLVAMPVMGYKAEGYKGAAKNLAMGVASCAVLSVGGVVSGAAQIVRGALNTPEALRETYSNEKMWHHGRREWIEVRLQSDIQSVPHDDSDLIVAARRRQAEEDASAPAAVPSPSIAGTSSSLYDVLEVSRTASTSEVRRAYAKMALKHHPDKNVGDPNAADRFKAVNEAYRVLSDEAARAEYDRTGRRPGQGGPGGEVRLPGLHLHPLQEMLGGEALLPWMGHLRLAVVYVNTDYSLEGSELAEWQRRRVLRVAAHMAQFLSTMEELGRTEGALALSEFLTRKTRELFAASHGRDLMALIANRWHVVALRYKSAADGSVLGRGSAIVEDYRQSVVSVGHSATTVFKTIRQMHTQRQLTPDDAIPMLLQFAESDIVDTVDTAADMVLHDLSVSRDDRWVRMHHLTQLAEFVFHQLADPARRMA